VPRPSSGAIPPSISGGVWPAGGGASFGPSPRERASHLVALQEGRAAAKSGLAFDAWLDSYLAALEQGGAREKTVRGNR
jgi:hypothetical protein